MAISLGLYKNLILTILLLFVSVQSVRSKSAHDILEKYGLPKGLLPNNVKHHSLDDDGTFEVKLKSSCYVQFPSYLVYYEQEIKGKLSYGGISNLSGIQVKEFFVWVSVTGIVAHSDKSQIEFQVGFISQYVPESDFEDIPTCKSSVSCRGAAGILSNAGLLYVS